MPLHDMQFVTWLSRGSRSTKEQAQPAGRGGLDFRRLSRSWINGDARFVFPILPVRLRPFFFDFVPARETHLAITMAQYKWTSAA